MKRLLFIILLAPFSIYAQKDGFTSVNGIDKLDLEGQHITMNYGAQTGEVNGEKVAIIQADCDPFKNQTNVFYRQGMTVFHLVFQFDQRGIFTRFSIHPFNQKS